MNLNIYDLYYDDLAANPLNEIQKLYQFFGLPWPEDFESRIQAYLLHNPKNKYGTHKYIENSIPPEKIMDSFSMYLQEFPRLVR